MTQSRRSASVPKVPGASVRRTALSVRRNSPAMLQMGAQPLFACQSMGGSCKSFAPAGRRSRRPMAPRTLLIGDLAAIVGGELRFGSLPPLAGTAEPIRRIVLDHREVEPGDVFWAITAPRYVGARRAEAAFLRGALGVVVSGRHVEPWAGRFSLRVLDANAALLQLNQVLSDRSTGSMSARAA